ncbi:PEP-CTERM sorting domain-containing protein [Colwellia hornerae]|uniref:PEP-CTERM sorting domain-containing protein n=1 Tax=Colwellia hornerae TaxID=89402 RepID=A0A5C6Q511_9GAMM|nr:PEP-CTERM sorting domain-containing protein [Colwellia hornerae]TWX48097.1 PEP-CTERM sorting domain-containing protein [Colwellia hornerae]TWX55098.1 PEP-CTERM sorting domain-containing protein [Colwellia hornerae]TWX63994.1 PEP-CTERM sorting domain-containing protein [Colwellia hornerae]
MKFKFLKAALVSTILVVSSFANAGLITFNDRASFEAYIGGEITDNLESAGTSRGSSTHTVGSNDFSWTMNDYNCEDGDGCSASFGGTTNNSPMMQSADDDFIWTYNNGAFNFTSGISSFGLQFGSHYGNSAVTLNGMNSGIQVSGSFFGIASDDNSLFNSVSYAKSLSYGSFDDVTYSRSNQSRDVPEPSTLAIFALGMIGLASRRFKKQS